MVYGDGTKLVGISCDNVGHTPPVRVDDDLAWFGIPGTGTSTTLTTSVTTSATKSTTTSTSTTSSTAVSGSGTAQHWGQW
jgi:hypothetical protein